MLETFTPAVCRSRKRQIVAQVFFAISAILAAAALGLALGLAGSLLGGRRAVLVAAALAILAAAREAGLLRLPLPQARRQVPERWRFELPLPVWASGYGAGLGAGLFTFQPVATFWVACAGAVALARPLAGALCLSLYGAGRALMIVWPRRSTSDPTAAVEALLARRGTLLRANVVALVACGVLLAVAPAAGAATRVASNALDPAVYGGTVAYTSQDGNVVVLPKGGGQPILYPGGSQPSLWGPYMAYVDGGGIRIVRWANRSQIARVGNHRASRPALDWPLLAFVRRDPSNKRLIVRNMNTGAYRIRHSVKGNVDLGRPSLRNGRVAFHVTSRNQSRIKVLVLKNGRKLDFASTKIGLLGNPSLNRNRIVWTDARSGVTRIRQGWFGQKRKRVLATAKSRSRSYWTTDLTSSRVYWTRWMIASGQGDIFQKRA